MTSSSSSQQPKTLYDKVFESHVVATLDEDSTTAILYIDRHLVHEVTSPQAFEGLKVANRSVRRPDCTLATVDHNIPTTSRATFKSVDQFVVEKDSKLQCVTLEKNVKDFGLTYFGMEDKRQGIVHVIGPEQGFTLPGTTVVCGDSHTSTHGAFGALAFGIGTSEVEHVLATQTLLVKKSKNMRIKVTGELPTGVTSKDLILHIIGVIGTAGGTGSVIEFCGDTIERLSIEARMSMCNMSIEAGARAGMVAPDQITFEYLKGRPLAPPHPSPLWDAAIANWSTLKTDEGAKFDVDVHINAADVAPSVTWGTSPQDVVPITGSVPDPASFSNDPRKKQAIERALAYMDLKPNQPMTSVVIDKVFIGSCTNSRIEDLRSAAQVVKGRKVASNIKAAMVVPGSVGVKHQAEAEGLDKIFKQAGFDWREAGCSMCLGMNPDQLSPGERCASTSNRNFEGRQGPRGRTHLVSPAMAAAAAVTGKLSDVRELLQKVSKDSDSAVFVVLDSKDYIGADLGFTPSFNAETTITTSSSSSSAPAPVSVAAAAATTTTPSSTAGGLEPFRVLTGTAAPMDMSNVDTDMIIPKQFLKTIKRTGLGTALFHELRRNVTAPIDPSTGQHPDNPSFILNQLYFKSSPASILIARANFGCGSSREHAPWALKDYGIRCVIAESFADIFYGNCFKNMILPVVLPAAQVEVLMADAIAACNAGKPVNITVDLEKCVVKSPGSGVEFAFSVDAFRRECLLQGWDDIGVTLRKEGSIKAFEESRKVKMPWLERAESVVVGRVKVVPRVDAKPTSVKKVNDW